MTDRVRQLLDRAAAVANFSAVQLMDAAGLSRHALAKWRSGERRPTRDNLRAVGDALAERGRAMTQAGQKLTEAAERREDGGA